MNKLCVSCTQNCKSPFAPHCILGFADHVVFMASTQLFPCSAKEVVGDLQSNVQSCVTMKHYSREQVAGLIHHTGCHGVIPVLSYERGATIPFPPVS